MTSNETNITPWQEVIQLVGRMASFVFHDCGTREHRLQIDVSARGVVVVIQPLPSGIMVTTEITYVWPTDAVSLQGVIESLRDGHERHLRQVVRALSGEAS